ncbi:MAG: prolipoprotein diacylglyceryl transferase [Planctomycetes bacterium]|nr:prolipoprotein diacylglyceryl transferase [Planctomycetota bacterium]
MWEFPAWDPVIVELYGGVALRWYGLAYVVAFFVAQSLMTRLQRDGFFRVEREQVGDLIFYTVIGTILGGRVGYALFYENELLHPGQFIQVWKGGLSFHGGLLGVVFAFALFARKRRLRVARLADVCALAVPPGIFCVRMANFVNGELYGRVCSAGTFSAMQFPTDDIALRRFGLLAPEIDNRARELGIQYAVGHLEWKDVADRLGPHAEQLEPLLDWDAVREFVPYRFPSQLYEGFGEGIVVGVLLWILYAKTRSKPLRPGRLGGVFLLAYGVIRWLIEFVRQPDRQFRDADHPIGTVFLGMTMGQLLCAGMIAAGLVMLLRPTKPDEVNERSMA